MRLLVRLIQHIWDTGKISTRMLFTIVVLTSKGASWDFRRMGLLEVVWKIVEQVTNTGLKCVPLHGATKILEVKLVHQLGSLKQSLFFGIFLDLKR